MGTPSKMTRAGSGAAENHNHNLNLHTPQRPQQVRAIVDTFQYHVMSYHFGSVSGGA